MVFWLRCLLRAQAKAESQLPAAARCHNRRTDPQARGPPASHKGVDASPVRAPRLRPSRFDRFKRLGTRAPSVVAAEVLSSCSW
jgi:hypothetical protein